MWKDFRAGELSPLLDGQIEFDKYYSGCKTLENFLPRPQGPASNRPGFRYVAGAKNNDRKCRLVPFEFSTTQAYILEFGHNYIRFFMNQGQIRTAVDAATKLLLHCNDVPDASTTFTDDGVTGHTITANGNAQIDTADKKFGAASGLFDGTGDYLTAPDHTDFDFSGGVFTIDFQIYPTALSGTGTIFYQETDDNN